MKMLDTVIDIATYFANLFWHNVGFGKYGIKKFGWIGLIERLVEL